MQSHFRTWLVAALCGLFIADTSRAANVNLQLLQLDPSLSGLIVTRSGSVSAPWDVTASVAALYSYDLLTLQNGKDTSSLVSQRLDTVVSLHMAISSELDFSASFAAVPFQKMGAKYSERPAGFSKDSSYHMGLADPSVQGRYELFHADKAYVDIALIFGVAIPIAKELYMGNGALTYTPELAVSRRLGPLLAAINLGYRTHPKQNTGGIPLNDEFIYRGGLGLDLNSLGLPSRTMLTLEASGAARANAPFQESWTSPLEALIGARVLGKNGFVFSGGYSMGLGGGYGSPAFRIVAQATWHWDGNEPPPPPEPPPVEPPAPEAPAPAPAPEAPPIVVVVEAPPLPIADRDGDTIADDVDQCPDEPETKNEIADDDGCPDLEEPVEVDNGELELHENIYFSVGNNSLLPRARAVLNEIVSVLQDHAEIHRVIIEGHTDNLGAAQDNLALSRQRAMIVKRYLVAHGIAGRRIRVHGYGESRPVVPNSTGRGRARNRRVLIFTPPQAAPVSKPDPGHERR